MDEFNSDESDNSAIHTSSSEGELSEDWEIECSTDTEQLIARIEREVTAGPMLIGGRIMTTEDPEEDEMVAGPSTSQIHADVTPKLDYKCFDREMCYALPKRTERTRIERCNTILPVLESLMSPPDHERGPSQDTPLVQPVTDGFHASYYIQNTRPYENISEVRYTGCMVCGRSVDVIKKEKVDWYMSKTTPRGEPEQITRLRREANENGLNTGSLLFAAHAMSQAAAFDGMNGMTVTTSAIGQEIVPGTLPSFYIQTTELLENSYLLVLFPEFIYPYNVLCIDRYVTSLLKQYDLKISKSGD